MYACIALRALNAIGPLVVVVFYRSGWCPHCNLELREWQRLLSQLHELGATLVAISPQTPYNSLSTAEKNDLAFPVLSDSGRAAAKAFGFAFTLSPDLVALYAKVGNDLPTLNGIGHWVLRIPATYLIDARGRLAFAHIEADYGQGSEPHEVLDTLLRLPTVTSFHPQSFCRRGR